MDSERSVNSTTGHGTPCVNTVTVRPQRALNVIETPVGLRQLGEWTAEKR